MGRFWIVLCLVVNIYNIQIPVIRMKYHPSVIWQFVHILFLSFNFNLYAFRGTDALQPPHNHMVHKHLARARRQSGRGFCKDGKFASYMT